MLSGLNKIEQEINNRKTAGKFPSIWKSNHTSLTKPQVKEKHSRGMRKYFELSEKENTAHQNVWGAAKAAPRGKCIALTASSERKDPKPIIPMSK